MNDKELLMMAAKAAGINHYGEIKDGLAQSMNGACKINPWNPLTDDGDALRLAVKLRMDINISHRTNEVIVFTMTDKINRADETWSADVNEYAATRRAIVRAAAEIGAKL